MTLRFLDYTGKVLIFLVIFLFLLTPPDKDNKFSNSKKPLGLCLGDSCSEADFARTELILKNRLQKESSIDIYNEVKRELELYDQATRHRAGHIFGQVLYESEGFEGIVICDQDLHYGCYHGLISQTVTHEKVDSIKRIDKKCVEQFGLYNHACQHGIGHGLIEYLGSNQLDKILELCSGLTWKHELLGCSGGAFMEYLMPAESKIGLAYVKPIDPQAPYRPCDIVQDKYTPQCYYNLGQYYYHAYNRKPDPIFTLCNNLSSTLNRRMCLTGIGVAIALSNDNSAESIYDFCSQARDESTKTPCLAGGGWMLFSNGQTRANADKICQTLSDGYRQKCQSDIDLNQLALTL